MAAGAMGAAALGMMVVLQVASGVSENPAGFTGPIVTVMAVSAVCFAAAARGWGRAGRAFAAAALIGYAAEAIGESTGFPFGQYRYSGVLWPEVGPVPVTVCVAWGGMGLAAYGVGTAISTRWAVVLGASALTGWDLFLDPQMVRLGLWTWAEGGPYRGVPLTNFAGWLLVSLLVMAAIRRTLGVPFRSRGLTSLYTVMAAMETLAFAAVFEPRDPLVAALGGVTMGAFALMAWRRGREPGRTRQAGFVRNRGRLREPDASAAQRESGGEDRPGYVREPDGVREPGGGLWPGRGLAWVRRQGWGRMSRWMVLPGRARGWRRSWRG
ncbi:carotenoid biosynthesis protein [Thermopolyspora sp. NPDC052614]|uniref:carotenoid biosynthesis protein n=1 Tax=Thermopolyspora sp. NPDC052614 TaxID=3155682 RepID=UPI00341B80FA